MKKIIQNVRCSYVFLNEPREGMDGGDPKYSVQILIPKDDPQLPEIRTMIKQVALEKFGDKIKPAKLKLPLRDGDSERDDSEYGGMLFMNANSTRKPGIVNKQNEPADPDDMSEHCYSGAYFHVSVNFYPFSNSGNKGVAVGLNNVMLRGGGERLDGRKAAAEEFDGLGTSAVKAAEKKPKTKSEDSDEDSW